MFTFKQFKIDDHRCAQRVGTDGVLLGAWAPVQGKQILDIGTGSGLIAVMIAQRTDAHITGIDIDADSIAQARDNAAATPWSNRLDFHLADVLTWQTDCTFDAIVSNPPFFERALECPDSRRSAARHTSSLPLPLLASRSAALLNPSGTLTVILPYDTASEFIFHCQLAGLYLSCRMDIKTVERKPYRRSMLHFIKGHQGNIIQQSLTLLNPDSTRTSEHIALTQDYYLH